MTGLSTKIFWPRTSLAGAVVICVLMAGRVLALDPDKSVYQFNCQSWTRQNGLPSDKINAITQTKDGYLWFGTQNGLVRFDGSDFKVVPVNLPPATAQEVRGLAAAQAGGLWLSVYDGVFGRYDEQTFSTVGDERWTQPGLNANAVLESRSGALWGGSDLGLSRWSPNPADENLFLSTPSQVVSLAEDAQSNIWAGTIEQGLYCWSNGKLELIPEERLQHRTINAVTADYDGRVWLGTGNGLLRYDGPGRLTDFPQMRNEVKALLIDRHGTLWLGTTGNGLVRYQNGIFTELRKADGLASDSVTSLFEDTEGSLWVGTLNGISQLTDVKFPIYSSRDGINEGSVTCVAPARNGGLWLSTAYGLSWTDGKRVQNFTNGPISPFYLKTAYEARNGDVYMVDGNKALDVLSHGKISLVRTNSQWPDAFAEDSGGILEGVGGSLFRLQDGKLTPYVYTGERPRYYWINNLHVARDGGIWVASNNGIYRVKDGAVEHWVVGQQANCLFEDEDGSIWAGVVRGVARIKNGEEKIMGQDEGILDDRIYSIIADDRGYFWFNSGKGIFRVTRQALNEVADGKSARLTSESFNGLESVKVEDRVDQEFSGCETADGRIWFPGPAGVVMIDPHHYFVNRVAPPVYIREILVNGTEMKDRNHAVFHAGDKRVHFYFTALSYIAPKQIRMQYQLVGFDPGWIDAGPDRQALYTDLKPGNYTFRVRGGNADGIWNETGDSFNLELPPPFYKTWWFYSLLGGVLILVALGIFRLKVRNIESHRRKLQAANDLLEAKVAGRTAELAIANRSLQSEIEGHKRTELELKQRKQALEAEIEERERMQLEVERIHHELLAASRMAGMAEVATGVIHNVGNVLNSVNVSTTLLTESLSQSKVTSVGRLAALLEEQAGNLGDFLSHDPRGRRLPAYLKELAEHLKGEQEFALRELTGLQKNIGHIKDIVTMQQSYAKVAGVTQSVNVPELVDDALRLNESALHRHNIQIVREYDPAVPEIVADKHKVMQILVNLIRNAKYACDEGDQTLKRVVLGIRNGDGRVKVSVADNGVGIPPENLNRIFNHGFTTRKNGHGFGLHSGSLAAKEMGGELTVHSDGPGCGACFTVELPLQPPAKS